MIDPRNDPRLAPIPNPIPPDLVAPPGPPTQAVPGPNPALPPPLPPVAPAMHGPLPPPGPEQSQFPFIDAITGVLDAPRNFAWSWAPGGYQGMKDRFMGGLFGPQAEPVRWFGGFENGQYKPATPAHKALLQGLGPAASGTLLDIMADPTTYLMGTGVIKSTGTALAGPVAKVAGPLTAAKVIEAFALGDRLLERTGSLPFELAGKGIGGAIKTAAKIPGSSFGAQVLEDGGARASTSLYDWATHLSPESALKMIDRQLQNVSAHLRNQGQTLEMGLSDWLTHTARDWPGTISAAQTQLNTLQTNLQNQMLKDVTANPHLRDFAGEIALQLQKYRDTLSGRMKAMKADMVASGASGHEIAAKQAEFIRESWQQMMNMHEGAASLWSDLTSQVTGPRMAGLTPEESAHLTRKIFQRMDQLRFLQHDLPGWMADLPNRFQTSNGDWYGSLLNRSMTDFNARYRDLVGHFKQWDNALRYVWDQRMKGTPFPTIAAATPEERWTAINKVMTDMGLAPAQGAGELYGTLSQHLPVSQANKLKDTLEFWGQDFFKGDLFDTVTSRVVREHAKALGIENPGPIRSFGRDFLQFWKTQAIDTPAYLLSNLMGGLFMGALRGVEPMSVMRGLSENIGRAWRGGHVEISPLTRINQMMDTVTPHELSSATGASFLSQADDVKSLLNRGTSIMDKIGPAKLAAGGAALGAYSGYTDTPVDKPESRGWNMAQGALGGGLYGGTLPVTTKYILTRLGGGLEAVMRQTAHMKAFTSGIESRGGELVKLAEDALMTRRGGVSVTPGPAIDSALNAVRARNGFISPRDFEDMLRGFGVDADVARMAGKEWRNHVDAAVQEGSKFASTIHFDYEHLNNLEQLGKAFMPFATWGMKAYPFFMEELVKHPKVSLALLRATLEGEKARQEGKLGERFAGAVHVPALDQFWSAVTGKQQQAWLNPQRGLTPFSDISQIGSINEDDTPLDKGLKVVNALGGSFNPFMQTLLRMTPFTNPSQPAQGYLRASGPIQGATGLLGAVNGRGIQLDALTNDIEKSLRLAFRGLEPTDVQESAILRRLDELALKETGRPITAGHISGLPYLEAKYLRSGQHWDRAQAEVQREAAGRSIYGYFTQIGAPRALLGQEEAAIRGAQAKRALDFKTTEAIKQELQAGNSEKIRADLVPAMTKAAYNISARYGEHVLPPEVQQILMIPTVANLEQLRKWINEDEAGTNPLHLGYSGGGSPEEVRLANAMSAYYSVPFLFKQDPMYKNLSPERLQEFEQLFGMANARQGKLPPGDPLGQIQTYVLNRRNQMLAEEPVLAAYLRWQQSQRGYGNPRQFIKEVWGNPAQRRALQQSQMTGSP